MALQPREEFRSPAEDRWKSLLKGTFKTQIAALAIYQSLSESVQVKNKCKELALYWKDQHPVKNLLSLMIKLFRLYKAVSGDS